MGSTSSAPSQTSSPRSRGRRAIALALSIVLGLAVVAGIGLYIRDLRHQVDDLEQRVERGMGGSFVALMRSNPLVAPGDTLTELVRLSLPPGRYQVFGKVGLQNRGGGSAFDAVCALIPSNPDGTPRHSGAVEADVGFLNLAPTGPGNKGEFSLSASQELEQPGSIVLGCYGTGSEFGGIASYGSIRAIEVGSIETDLGTP